MTIKEGRVTRLWCAAVLAGLTAALGATVWPGITAEPGAVVFMLDWFPNPDHVPLYAAQAEGYFAQGGLRVTLQVPANPDDPLKLTAAGRVASLPTRGQSTSSLSFTSRSLPLPRSWVITR